MRLAVCSSSAFLSLALAGYSSWGAEPVGSAAFPPAALPEPGIVLLQQPAAPPRPVPAPAVTPPRPTPPRPTPAPPLQTALSTPAAEDLTSAPTGAGASPPELLGHGPPSPTFFPLHAGAPGGAVLPSPRTFQIADNESPQPLDRVYFSFNYFDNLFQSANRALGGDVRNLRVYSETFGLEKSCLDGAASIGLRLPLNTINADSTLPGLASTSTDVGDLSVILKYAFYRTEDNSRLLSAGLAVTAPTGPGSFAGDRVGRFHDTTVQPFLGYQCTRGNGFLHGFASVDVPTDSNEPTLLFNDLGAGYYLYRSPDAGRFLTGIAPTLEVHVDTPLSHRGGIGPLDPARASDLVDLTAGVNLEFLQAKRLALGVVVPTTGPKPFAIEALVQFRCSF
jgi:hypothetical protein